jgi:hypothetical protein
MEAVNAKARKVEDLSQYRQPLRMPKEAVKKQMGIAFVELRKKFGLIGLIPFFVKVLAEQRRLKKRYLEAVKQAQQLGSETASEFLLRSSMFKVLAKEDGREQAYEFLKGLFQKVSSGSPI